MKKWLYVPISILAVIAVLIVLFFVSLSSGRVIGAMLYVNEGVVEVDSGSGWQAAEDGMELSLDYTVRTLEGRATIALFEGEMIRLEPNTEISIKELSQERTTISQNSGSTWSRLTKLGGVAEYNIETPTTVATIRGTGFGLKISEQGVDVLVGEGTVRVAARDEAGIIESKDVAENERVRVIEGRLEKSALTPAEKAWVADHMNKDIETLKRVRIDMINRHKFAVGVIKTTFRLDDEDIKAGLNDLDEGELEEDELVEKSPIRIADLERVVAITKVIKRHKGTLKTVASTEAAREQTVETDAAVKTPEIARKVETGKEPVMIENKVVEVETVRLPPDEEVVEVEREINVSDSTQAVVVNTGTIRID